MTGKILIGCSGYYYNDWKGKFYPEKLPKKDWLPFYAEHFSTVEINNTFYRFPGESLFQRWKEITPSDFKFTIKGNRTITHLKKLKNVDELVSKFFNVADVLENKISSILWQFPPYLKRDDDLLKSFCSQLSTYIPQVIEFRHQSWFDEEVYKILEKYEVAYCIISAPDNLPETIKTTSPTAYLRFHGKDQWYHYRYSKDELAQWVEKIQQIEFEQLLIYFNNDYDINAVINGQEMKEMLSQIA